MTVAEMTRRLLSLLGDGDTGSPLSRFRARDTALTGICGGLREKMDESGEDEGCIWFRCGNGLGERLRVRGCTREIALPEGSECVSSATE